VPNSLKFGQFSCQIYEKSGEESGAPDEWIKTYSIAHFETMNHTNFFRFLDGENAYEITEIKKIKSSLKYQTFDKRFQNDI